jgi:hypothetical protein
MELRGWGWRYRSFFGTKQGLCEAECYSWKSNGGVSEVIPPWRSLARHKMIGDLRLQGNGGHTAWTWHRPCD